MSGLNGNTVAYDAENRVSSVYDTLTQATGTYLYDGDGQRVQKAITGGTAVVYVYDAFGQVEAEYSPAATHSKDYIRLNGQVAAIENAGSAPCTTCYFSYDHLGSVRMITDQNGKVIARHDYLPFGEEVSGDPPYPTGRSTALSFGASDSIGERFTGQVRDSETGMDFFNARYFGAALGRFTSVDPGNAAADLTDPQTWNGYGYVRGNPLALVDPSGMDFIPRFSVTGTCGTGCLGDSGLDADFSGPFGFGDLGLDPRRFQLFGTDPASGYRDSLAPLKFVVTVTAHAPKKVVRIGNYPTLDCDGYRAARSILPQTQKQGIEFGGFLYQNSNGRYSYSNPVSGTPTSIPSLFSSPQALVSGIAGWFHSHPLVPGYNNDMFSGNDLLITRYLKDPGYLVTADGTILKLSIDPKGYPQVSSVGSGACQVP